MRTRHSFILQYSDVDSSRHIRLSDLEKYLLEAGGVSANQMGFGTDTVLERYNCAWVLIHLTIEMDYLPKYLDEMVIETWVEDNYHMFSVRNYGIYIRKDGEDFQVGRATSSWTLLNMQTRQVDLRGFSEEVWSTIIDKTKVEFTRIPRLQKIDVPTRTLAHTIHYSDLDYNNHCNSCKYLQFMLNADDRLTALYPIRLDINYVKEVYKDERIQVDVLEKTDEEGRLHSLQYCLLAEDGGISCTALLQRVTQ